MTKKIKLSELKIKSSVTELNSKERKSTKGGFYSPHHNEQRKGKEFIQWIADTEVDIRIVSTPSTKRR